MASRKSTKMSRMRNIDPMPLTLTFATAQGSAGVPQVNYVDLSQCAALAGRKFFRQGLNYGVASIKCSSLLAGTISVYKLPNSWVMANAWMKSFSAWSKMNREALSETDAIRPRFLDFKIYADAEHHAAGSIANLLPLSVASTVPPVVGTTFAGEWEYSKVYIPIASNAAQAAGDDTMADFELIAVGSSYPGVSAATGLDAVSCIEGYASSRGLPNVLDPNAPDDAADTAGLTPENWMTAIFNEGETQSHEVIEDMITENNIAPYPFENGLDTNQFLPNSTTPNPNFNLPFADTMYPGGANQMQGLEWHDFANIYQTSATTNVGITTIKGGSFPCGLLKLVWTPIEGTPNLVFQINMIPGSHRGYLAESMQDM